MVSRALMSPATVVTAGAPTYGELVRLARDRAREAGVAASGPFASAGEAAGAVAGFERYLAVIGQHLRLIAAPGLAPTTGHADALPTLQQLIQRMSSLRLTPVFATPWGHAADTLATAHDLLATHLGPYGEQRTPEIEVLADPDQRQATTRMVLELLDDPLTVRDELLKASGGRAPRHRHSALVAGRDSAHPPVHRRHRPAVHSPYRRDDQLEYQQV